MLPEAANAALATVAADLAALTRQTVAVVQEAAALVRAMLLQPVADWAKADESPVTAIDLAVDAMLSERLAQLLPVAWLSEETVDDHARLRAPLVWVVDPIDGTRSLIEGSSQFAISVALVQHARPQLGVVCNPMTGELFYGWRGGGAFDGGGQALRVAPSAAAAGLRLVVSATEQRRGMWQAMPAVAEVRAVSSLAYKMALVASGAADATLTPWRRSEWDAAAGDLLVELAGGASSDIVGEPLRYNRPDPVFDGIVAAARQADPRVDAVRTELQRRRGEILAGLRASAS